LPGFFFVPRACPLGPQQPPSLRAASIFPALPWPGAASKHTARDTRVSGALSTVRRQARSPRRGPCGEKHEVARRPHSVLGVAVRCFERLELHELTEHFLALVDGVEKLSALGFGQGAVSRTASSGEIEESDSAESCELL